MEQTLADRSHRNYLDARFNRSFDSAQGFATEPSLTMRVSEPKRRKF